MSIHRLNGKYEQPGVKSFRTIAEKLDVPQYAPPELILHEIMKSKENGEFQGSYCSEVSMNAPRLKTFEICRL